MRALQLQENNLYNAQSKKVSNNTGERVFGRDITCENFQSVVPPSKILKTAFLSDEYTSDIYRNLHNIEELYMIKSDYMAHQASITLKMRAILVDWLLDVHLKFKLFEETLFLAVSILDRYLNKAKVTKEALQLVGITSMFIASKYQEISPPELNDFVYVTEQACTKNEIISTERLILKLLDFDLNMPTALTFFERYSRICKFDDFAYYIGLFLIEITLFEVSFLQFKPSTIASAAVFLSKKIAKNSLSTISKSQKAEGISVCVQELANLVANCDASYFCSVKKKFGSEKFQSVSKVMELVS